MISRMFPRSIEGTERMERIGRAAADALPPEFNMLVWNVNKARHRAWRADFKRFSPAQDLILLQESLRSTHLMDVFEHDDGLEWHMARSYEMSFTRFPTGLKTASRSRADHIHAVASPVTEPLAGTPKMTLTTRYRLEGAPLPLMVVNVHGINFVSTGKYRRHMGQVAELLTGHHGPVLLAGDFNCWNGPRRRFLDGLASGLGLRFLDIEDRKARIRHLNTHLDHIFYRGLTPLAACHHHDITSSDHAPLTARFSVAEQA